MGNRIKRKILKARKYFIFINSYNWKANGFTLSVFAMMVYVSGINERFNSDIVKTHNNNQYIYQVHIPSKIVCIQLQVQSKCVWKNQFSPHVKL